MTVCVCKHQMYVVHIRMYQLCVHDLKYTMYESVYDCIKIGPDIRVVAHQNTAASGSQRQITKHQQCYNPGSNKNVASPSRGFPNCQSALCSYVNMVIYGQYGPYMT